MRRIGPNGSGWRLSGGGTEPGDQAAVLTRAVAFLRDLPTA